MPNQKPFNGRGLTSFIILLSSAVIALSGVMLFISPKGRVANWTGWTLLGLSKTQWEAVHLAMALAFIVAAGFHIYFNWSYLMRYLRDAAGKGFQSKRELTIAVVLTAALFAGARLEIPPISTLVDAGECIKDYWEDNSPQSPYAHAEESTVAEFAVNMNLPLERVTERLHEKGLDFDDPSVVLGDLAELYGITPNELFALMTAGATGPSLGSGAGLGSGRGLGRMTFAEICAEAGVDVEAGRASLLKQGIEVRADDKVRDIVKDNGMTTPDQLLGRIAPEPQE